MTNDEPKCVDLKDFALAHSLPYDPAGKVDMRETLAAAMAESAKRQIPLHIKDGEHLWIGPEPEPK